MFKTTLVIKYPNGTTQVVKPNFDHFKGDWQSLAHAIAGAYYPRGYRVEYEVR